LLYGGPVVPDELPKSVGFSRRHLLKAVGVALGALSASLPGKASAQSQEDGQGWGWGHCFLRGTLIRGVDGYRPIETLAAGDRLPTRFSGTAVIRKIISYTVHRDDAGCWPEDCRLVRIRAGALGHNSPARDLFVTNAHAIFLDRVLVPVGSLVNGKTISFDERTGTDALDYFHIEFDGHDVIDAEGAFCESHRGAAIESCAPEFAFHGGRSQFTSHLRSAFAPLIDRRRPLDRIRDNLEARAGL
jgi:hypothetical protein